MIPTQGLPLLYGLLDEWLTREQMLAAWGAEPGALEEAFGKGADDIEPVDVDGGGADETEAVRRQARIAQVAAAARMLG